MQLVLPVTLLTLHGSLALLPMLFLALADTILMEATFANNAQLTMSTLLPAQTIPMRSLVLPDTSCLIMSAMDVQQSMLTG